MADSRRSATASPHRAARSGSAQVGLAAGEWSCYPQRSVLGHLVGGRRSSCAASRRTRRRPPLHCGHRPRPPGRSGRRDPPSTCCPLAGAADRAARPAPGGPAAVVPTQDGPLADPGCEGVAASPDRDVRDPGTGQPWSVVADAFGRLRLGTRRPRRRCAPVGSTWRYTRRCGVHRGRVRARRRRPLVARRGR
ncbi:hypothetical protein HBB16_20630 [Pseudonocardia sp. MCCB 268]|nr:hypothetical protein [Pseudonocardia cytotoxica]